MLSKVAFMDCWSGRTLATCSSMQRLPASAANARRSPSAPPSKTPSCAATHLHASQSAPSAQGNHSIIELRFTDSTHAPLGLPWRLRHLTQREAVHLKLYYSPGACSMSPHRSARSRARRTEAIARPQDAPAAGRFSTSTINPLGCNAFLVLDDGPHLREGPAIVQYL